MKKIFTNAEINVAARKNPALFIRLESCFPETLCCTSSQEENINNTTLKIHPKTSIWIFRNKKKYF